MQLATAIRYDIEFIMLIVNFIGYSDLIKNKRETGRLKDLDDIENLT